MNQANSDETRARDQILRLIHTFISENRRIKLPPFDPAGPAQAPHHRAPAFGPNDFGGAIGPYAYQFEGEEDLLHLLVTRSDGAELTVTDAQKVVSFLLPDLPPALIWLKPGIYSQHFYFGHDELLSS